MPSRPAEPFEFDQETLDAMGAVQGSRASYERSAPGVTYQPIPQWFSDIHGCGYDRPIAWGALAIQERNRKIRVVDDVLEKNGELAFILDIFASFVCGGIEVVHRSPTKQERLRHWWKKVGGDRVSERLVSELFRHAFAAVQHLYAVEPPGTDARWTGRLPIGYEIQPPTEVEPVGGELARLARDPRYGLRISASLRSKIANPENEAERAIVRKLPRDVVAAATAAEPVLVMGPDRLSVHHYKKDDYRPFADPLLYSILEDVDLYRAMKAADKSALKQALQRLRLIKAGRMDPDPKRRIIPNKREMTRLREQMLAIRNGETSDLLWHDAIAIEESKSDLAGFLGGAKYEPIRQAIYAALGIPQSIAGGGDGGLTNNALALKTLLARLRTARKILVDFWDGEFEKVRKAFGDRHAGGLRFELMSLSDEASEKKLWVDLYDRGVISEETLLTHFGEVPEVENARILREDKQRDSGRRQPRLGPYNEQAVHPDQFKKAVLNQGQLAPSEVGVERKPRKKGEKSLLDRQEEQARKVAAKPTEAPAPTKKKGVAGEGRPKGSKDSGGRKRRTPKIRQAAADLLSLQAEAREKLRVIEKEAQPAFLASLGKQTLRQLNAAESSALQAAKFALLMASPPGEPVVADLSASPTPCSSHSELLNDLIARSYASRGVNPTVDDVREMQAAAYALHNSEIEDPDGHPESDD